MGADSVGNKIFIYKEKTFMELKEYSEPILIIKGFDKRAVLMSADFVGEGDYDYSGAIWED